MTLTVDDRLDLQELLVRYATGIDRRDFSLLRSVFAEDCVADYGVVGTFDGAEALVAFMELAHRAAGHTMHRITNQAITEVDGTVTSRCYVDALVFGLDNQAGVRVVGHYDDVLTKGATGWQIARRTFTQVMMEAVTA